MEFDFPSFLFCEIKIIKINIVKMKEEKRSVKLTNYNRKLKTFL